MKQYQGYLIDLDGTMYQGNQKLMVQQNLFIILMNMRFHIYSLPIILRKNLNKWQISSI